MWVEFVVGSLLCSERFFLGSPVFPSPQQPTCLNSNSIWIIIKHFIYEPLAWVIAQALPMFDVKFTFPFFYVHITASKNRKLVKILEFEISLHKNLTFSKI